MARKRYEEGTIGYLVTKLTEGATVDRSLYIVELHETVLAEHYDAFQKTDRARIRRAFHTGRSTGGFNPLAAYIATFALLIALTGGKWLDEVVESLDGLRMAVLALASNNQVLHETLELVVLAVGVLPVLLIGLALIVRASAAERDAIIHHGIALLLDDREEELRAWELRREEGPERPPDG